MLLPICTADRVTRRMAMAGNVAVRETGALVCSCYWAMAITVVTVWSDVTVTLADEAVPSTLTV